jgi:hypothetical protein
MLAYSKSLSIEVSPLFPYSSHIPNPPISLGFGPTFKFLINKVEFLFIIHPPPPPPFQRNFLISTTIWFIISQGESKYKHSKRGKSDNMDLMRITLPSRLSQWEPRGTNLFYSLSMILVQSREDVVFNEMWIHK